MTASSERLAGALGGRYRVDRVLGEGGMATVFLAHDVKHDRKVALKVLRPELAAVLGTERFLSEIAVTAKLQHPHVLPLFDSGEAAGLIFYVMPHVEGETLRQRLGREKQLAIDDAVAITGAVASALDYAHRRGVIHRDIKPENILFQDGQPVVADFGIALAVSAAGGARLTETGLSLGTPQYMSPEQATGERQIDHRTDIYSLGAVMYEMLAGGPPYTGPTIQAILAQVVGDRPRGIRSVRDTVPPHVEAAVLKALEKVPGDRFKTVTRFAEALRTPVAPGAAVATPPEGVREPRTRRLPPYAGWAAAALVALAAATGLVPTVRGPPRLPDEVRLHIVTPAAADPLSLAMSPDGRSMVYQAELGPPRLWLRRLDVEEARPLAGTEGAVKPFWSPDSRSVGFFADGRLKRIDVAGEYVRVLADAPQSRGGTWNEEDTIVFGAASVGPLFRVPADGGPVEQATTLLPSQTNHRWPQFLPDGRRFLFMALGEPGGRGVYLESLEDTSVRRVSDREEAYGLMAPGYILFARQGALWARRAARNYSRVEGDFLPVAPKVLAQITTSGYGAFSSSSVGSIAYRASAGEQQLAWVDRGGRLVAALGQPDDTQLWLWHLSADGRGAAVHRRVAGNTDVWLVDTERGTSRRLTFDPAIDGAAVLSPDGNRVAYMSDGKADVWSTLYEQAADGTPGVTVLHDFGTHENRNPSDWSADGRYVLYATQSLETGWDLWALPVVAEGEPIEIARTAFQEQNGRFSTDGAWVAYESNESGRTEIYVRPFRGPAPKIQLSAGGGTFPRWRRDGRELFYLAPDNRVMAVSLTPRGSDIEAGVPRPLFPLAARPPFEPSPDGQRFLVTLNVSDPSPITVILNWRPPAL